jgi:hypothetical protein
MLKDNQAKKKAIKDKLYEADLKDVKEKCALHGFTASQLCGGLKLKGAKNTATVKSAAAKKASAKKDEATSFL